MRKLSWHPFPVVAHLERSIVLAYAVDAERLRSMIPSHLELDTFQDRYGFLAVAMVKTRQLRPAGFPAFLGRDFFLAGFRIFVRYTGEDGRRRRGLYILKSLTDRRTMCFFGNLFTQYRYEHRRITWDDKGDHQAIHADCGLAVKTRRADDSTDLPAGSPFENWRQARLFAGPMPFTFSYDESANSMVIVEGVRGEWKVEPLVVEQADVPDLADFGLGDAVLANAFSVSGVDYRWKKGAIERC